MSEKKLILVVDDEIDLREILREEFEYTGYSVVEAENGMKAIEVLNAALRSRNLFSREFRPDLKRMNQHTSEHTCDISRSDQIAVPKSIHATRKLVN